MAGISPTQRALAKLKRMGAVAQVVERFNAFGGPPHMRCQSCGKNRIGSKSDLFGMFDILALLGVNIIGIQVTSGANHASRVNKIKAEPRARAWLLADGIIEIWSYALRGKRGKKKEWELRMEEIVLKDLDPIADADLVPEGGLWSGAAASPPA